MQGKKASRLQELSEDEIIRRLCEGTYFDFDSGSSWTMNFLLDPEKLHENIEPKYQSMTELQQGKLTPIKAPSASRSAVAPSTTTSLTDKFTKLTISTHQSPNN
jgi:hypothetical protein